MEMSKKKRRGKRRAYLRAWLGNSKLAGTLILAGTTFVPAGTFTGTGCSVDPFAGSWLLFLPGTRMLVGLPLSLLLGPPCHSLTKISSLPLDFIFFLCSVMLVD